MGRKQKTMEADQIQKLLEKCLSGGSAREWDALRTELEKDENAELRAGVFQLGDLPADGLRAAGDKMWREISRHKTSGRNLFLRKLLRYAAVIAIPLLLGSVIFWAHRLKQETAPLSVAAFEPGHLRAILKLENGEQIDLAAAGRDTVFTRKGITIRLDSSRSVLFQSGKAEGEVTGYNTVVVPRGGEYRLVLADGTIVWLNSDSELKFPVAFTGAKRRVFLKGEAYFDVAKNPDLPFVVDVARMEVEVLGTQFNINAYREGGVFQTTLVSGKVQVYDLRKAEHVILLPNQQARVKDGHLSVLDVDASEYTSWREGKFYFESEPLLEIVAQLERWYDIDFFFSREELKNYEFTGVIRRDLSANQILDIIAKTTNVCFEIKGRTVTVR